MNAGVTWCAPPGPHAVCRAASAGELSLPRSTRENSTSDESEVAFRLARCTPRSGKTGSLERLTASLPTDLLPTIFAALPAPDLARAACVARAWRHAAGQPYLWRRHLDDLQVCDGTVDPAAWRPAYVAWTACRRYPPQLVGEVEGSALATHARLSPQGVVGVREPSDLRFHDLAGRQTAIAHHTHSLDPRVFVAGKDVVTTSVSAGSLQIWRQNGCQIGSFMGLFEGDGDVADIAVDNHQVAVVSWRAFRLDAIYTLTVLERKSQMVVYRLRLPNNLKMPAVAFFNEAMVAIAWDSSVQLWRRDRSEFVRELAVPQEVFLHGQVTLTAGRIAARAVCPDSGDFLMVSYSLTSPATLHRHRLGISHGRTFAVGDILIHENRPPQVSVVALGDDSPRRDFCVAHRSAEPYHYIVDIFRDTMLCCWWTGSDQLRHSVWQFTPPPTPRSQNRLEASAA